MSKLYEEIKGKYAHHNCIYIVDFMVILEEVRQQNETSVKQNEENNES